MKKLVVAALGIVFAFACVGCTTPTVEEINHASYLTALEKVIEVTGAEDVSDYSLQPKVTRDGIVEAYGVYDADGAYIGSVSFEK